MVEAHSHDFITDFACRPLDAERAHSALYKLLRLSPPDARYGEALQYLIQSHALQPKQDLAAISQWSYAQLAQVAGQWLYPNTHSFLEIDIYLTALWVLEESQQCKLGPWLQNISQRLVTNTAMHQAAPHTASGLSSEENTFSGETLYRWLSRTGVLCAQPDDSKLWEAKGSSEAELEALLYVYLQHPFPWSALLTSITEASFPCHPSVQRLHGQYQALLNNPPATWPVLSWSQCIQALQSIIKHPEAPSEVIPLLKATRCRPVGCVVLVEGTSEIVLLPAVAQALGKSLAQHHVQLVAVGGKSLMLKAYHQLSEFISRPIMALLDADGVAEQQQLSEAMQSSTQHSAVILPEGTLEDALSDGLVAQTVNEWYDPPEPLTPWDIAERRKAGRTGNQTITALETLFSDWELASPRKGSHKEKQFNKVDFAYHVAQTLLNGTSSATQHPVSPSLEELIHQAISLATQALPPLQA